MKLRTKIAMCVLACLLAGAAGYYWLYARASAPPVARLCVVNILSQDLSVIDPTSNREMARIPLGNYGYGAAVTRQGDLAYVTAADFPETGKKWNSARSKLLIVDLHSNKVVETISISGLAPLARVHLRPDGKFAYLVTAGIPGQRKTERGRVLFVDLRKRRITATVNVGLNPLDSALTPDGSYLFTADWNSRAVSVVNLRDRRLEDTIPFGESAPRLLAIAPNGEKLFVALDQHGVAEVNLRSRAVSRWQVGSILQATAITVSAQGTVYLAGRSEDGERQLVAINPKAKRIIKDYGYYGYVNGLRLDNNNQLYLVGGTEDNTGLAIQNARQSIYNNIASNGVSTNEPLPGDTLRAVRNYPKALIVLDAKNGNTKATIPIGTFPLGFAGN